MKKIGLAMTKFIKIPLQVGTHSLSLGINSFALSLFSLFFGMSERADRSFHSFWKEWKSKPHFSRAVRTFLVYSVKYIVGKIQFLTQKRGFLWINWVFQTTYFALYTKKCALPLKSVVRTFTLLKKSEMSE